MSMELRVEKENENKRDERSGMMGVGVGRGSRGVGGEMLADVSKIRRGNTDVIVLQWPSSCVC